MTLSRIEEQFTPNEIYRALDIDNNLEITDANQLLIKQDFENCRPDIERFVHKVVGSVQLGYEIKPGSSGSSSVKELALGRRYFVLLKAYVQAYIPGYSFSPYVELFFQCCSHLNIGNWASLRPDDKLRSGLFVGEMFNRLLAELRQGVNKRKFNRKLASRKVTSERGFESCKKYFNALMEVTARLLVLRVDFGYQKDYAASVSPEELKVDLKQFLDSRRSSPVLKTLVGYIRRLEYGDDKKLHLHMVFFLNGSESQNDAWLADEYGKQWQKCCASGKGLYFNCNRKKSAYKYLGVGMIEYHNYEKRSNFIAHVLSYLAKKDQYLISKVTKKMRCLAHGEISNLSNANLLGRPRSRPTHV